jgi:ElaB/YqjD/DUF883 family membrane-anchored ribosome-binding protein
MTDTPTRLATDLAEGYEEVTRGLARMSKHIGVDASDGVSQAAHKFVHAASDLAEQIRRQSEHLARKAGEEVRDHPAATAALVAAAVGLLGFAATASRHRSSHR